jgi:membrane metallo-endopeptidase-like protein 1
VHTASSILNKVNDSINPCDDFYNFACGKFIAETNIPDEEVSVDTFSLVDNTLNAQLLKLISKDVTDSEIKPFKLAKQMYKACMDEELIEERGIKPLLDIHERLGGWPVVKGDSWDEKNWTWVKAVQSFRKTGYSIDYIFDLSVEIDSKNSSRRTLDVSLFKKNYFSQGMCIICGL